MTTRPHSALAAALLVVSLLAPPAQADPDESPGEVAGFHSLQLFFESLEKIQDHYVDELSTEELVRFAIDGIVGGLDEHSRFLEPDAFTTMRARTRGTFSGIGVVVALRGGTPTIVSPIDGTPARRAGIRAGDRLVGIGNTDTRTVSLDEVVALLRGEVGTIVRVAVERSGAADPIEFMLQREEIAVESVIGPIHPRPGVAYVRVGRFSETTGAELARALDDADGSGAAGLVLDLRDNPGGLLSQGVEVAERFIPIGETIVEVRSRNQIDSRVYRSGVTRKWSRPLVVLVDGGTASAAEIVAGAIQDHGAGTLLGEPTFGKGSVQSIFAFDEGHALKLTTALYFTPGGRSVEPRGKRGAGLEPDVAIAASVPDSLMSALVVSGTPTAFLAETDPFSLLDFSIPLDAGVLARFREFATDRGECDVSGVDDDRLDRCLRAEIALRDGGQRAVLELRLPDDPVFERAVEILADGAAAAAAAHAPARVATNGTR